MKADSKKAASQFMGRENDPQFFQRLATVYGWTGVGIVVTSVVVMLFDDYTVELATEILLTPRNISTETDLIALFLVVAFHCLLIGFAGQKLIDFVSTRLDVDDLSGARVMYVLALTGHAILINILIAVGNTTGMFSIRGVSVVYFLLSVVVLGSLVLGSVALSNKLNPEHNTERILRSGLVFLLVWVSLLFWEKVGPVLGALIGIYAVLLIDSQMRQISNLSNVPVLALSASSLLATLGIVVVAFYNILLWILKVLWALVRFFFRFIPS